jgi:signal transduction histidine kinase
MPLRLLAPRALWQAAADHLTVAVEHGVAGAARVRDERRRTWEIVATRFVPPGSVEPRVIVVARELTALIALQDELQRQETLSRMGELVAGVAHEVRNPLFAISSALDTLIARLAGNPDFVRYAPVLQQQVGRLSHLMQDLLDYGKPPALILRDVAVADIVNDAVQLTRSLAGERQVAVVPQVLVAAGTTARVDRERIAQVFQNLLANAIQHSPAQATIELTARLGALADGEWLEVVTCDQGGGFDVDDLPHLFEPFFSRRPGGTGLGLALAHRVVHDHGGTLVAENRSTGGAMVTVRLPIDATPRN